MNSSNKKTKEEAEIQTLMDGSVQAVRIKDLNKLMSNYWPEVISFGMAPPLSFKGKDAHRENAEQWMGTWEGPIGYELRDLQIAASADVAFAHHLSRVTGTKKDGQKVDMWFRSTVCFRKIDGTWMVTHQHTSEPFDMKTFQAKLDLNPETVPERERDMR